MPLKLLEYFALESKFPDCLGVKNGFYVTAAKVFKNVQYIGYSVLNKKLAILLVKPEITFKYVNFQIIDL